MQVEGMQVYDALATQWDGELLKQWQEWDIHHKHVKNTFIEIGEPSPKLRRTSSDPSFYSFSSHGLPNEAEDVPLPALEPGQRIIQQWVSAKTQIILDFPKPEALLMEGMVMLLPRPPHNVGGLEDADVEVVGKRECFTRRMNDLAALQPPAVEWPDNIMSIERQRANNDRQKERQKDREAKIQESRVFCDKFHLKHIPAATLVPEVRALGGYLNDFIKNKVKSRIAKMSESERSSVLLCAAQHVFQEVGLFLRKYHNHPDGDLLQLKRLVECDPGQYTKVVLEWAGADKNGLMLKAGVPHEFLGQCFAGTISDLVDQALENPERRRYLRQSRHLIPCWRIKIPISIEGMYIGDSKTVKSFLQQVIDSDQCLDVQRMYKFTIVMIERPGNSWDCKPGPITQFPSGGWVYTTCELCNGRTELTNCKCIRWMRTFGEITDNMTRTQLPMDEMLIPEHCSGMVLGPPTCKQKEEQGAINLRQFTSLKVNALALGFADLAKK
eukprot:gnl/MRDRNA2_/MRDRNA2_73608_c0_seq1.p1 gnl/MRDRNA2_/MRDRNA2_73608_c0~~gnl/MRDRNA2_/MRDRNA2_73608_c0_seq1.p1  ORF type:complete len:498 (+),score=96.04 gnl/MRDRNA2_/MRDRNA2_73608_c0_seq1:82-1575(+)